MPAPLLSDPSRPKPRCALRIVLTLALVLLHALAGLWFAGYRAPANPDTRDDTPVEVELLKPQPIERAPRPAPQPAARPAPAKAAEAKPVPAPAHDDTPVLTTARPSPATTAPPRGGVPNVVEG